MRIWIAILLAIAVCAVGASRSLRTARRAAEHVAQKHATQEEVRGAVEEVRVLCEADAVRQADALRACEGRLRTIRQDEPRGRQVSPTYVAAKPSGRPPIISMTLNEPSGMRQFTVSQPDMIDFLVAQHQFNTGGQR